MGRFRDRIDAGRTLAGVLTHLRDRDPLVLGIPRGGMVVAAEVARALGAPLGMVLAAKVGTPWSREMAIGAVAPDGVALLHDGMIDRMGLADTEVEAAVEHAAAELDRRRHAYGVGLPDVAGRVVVVVDDGVATGATLRAVLGWVSRHHPERLVCAVPVGPPATIDLIASEIDEIVCPIQPERFRAVGEWYDDFGQVSDEEVMELVG